MYRNLLLLLFITNTASLNVSLPPNITQLKQTLARNITQLNPTLATLLNVAPLSPTMAPDTSQLSPTLGPNSMQRNPTFAPDVTVLQKPTSAQHEDVCGVEIFSFLCPKSSNESKLNRCCLEQIEKGQTAVYNQVSASLSAQLEATFKIGTGVNTINSHTKHITYENKVYFCIDGGYLFCSYYMQTKKDGKWKKSARMHDPMEDHVCFTYSQCDISPPIIPTPSKQIIGIAVGTSVGTVILVLIAALACKCALQICKGAHKPRRSPEQSQDVALYEHPLPKPVSSHDNKGVLTYTEETTYSDGILSHRKSVSGPVEDVKLMMSRPNLRAKQHPMLEWA